MATSASYPNSHDVQLTRGSPEHASVVVPLIYQTAERLYSFIYDERSGIYEVITAACWRAPRSEFSHRFATVACCEDRVAGVLIAYKETVHREQRALTAEVAGPLLDQRLKNHLQNVLPSTHSLTPPIPDSAYYIKVLSVNEAAQGRGIGSMLLMQAFDLARQARCDTVQLDTAANGPAVEFYQRMGMEIAIETRVPRLQQQAGLGTNYRMTKRLSD